ncbi:MAG TPA: hypothetical protein VGJ92_13190 [Methanocella sp.]
MLRVLVVRAIILVTIALLLLTPAEAQVNVGSGRSVVNIGIPFVFSPDFTFAAPFSIGSAFQTMANTSALAHDFTGSFALAFPAVQGLNAGSQPVFSPTIAQTTSESIAASRSYFFADFLIA